VHFPRGRIIHPEQLAFMESHSANTLCCRDPMLAWTQRLATAALSFAVQARQLGVDPEDALRRARRALETLAPQADHA
jgi:hypothetical protein